MNVAEAKGPVVTAERKETMTVALENVLRELIRVRRERAKEQARLNPPDLGAPFEFIRASNLEPYKSRRQQYFEELATPPNEQCRERIVLLALHWIGEQLNHLGGDDLMLEICQEAASRNPGDE